MEDIKEKTADEMFEELGYKIDYENSYVTRFYKEDNLFGKTIEFYHIFKTFNKLESITMQELQAINKKCKELGWI